MSKILCNCKDSLGKPKQSYLTERQANNQKNFIEEDREVFLEVYECPEKLGWHLTKASNKLVSHCCNNYFRSKSPTINDSVGNSLSKELINDLKNLNK